MPSFHIEEVRAREILDSRGRPTVEAEVRLSSGARGRAAVPSGASTGSLEAHELRDEDERYYGNGVAHAVRNVNTEINAALRGSDARRQAEVDADLINLDGTPNKQRLGANALLGVSLATARAAAAHARLPLYRYLREELGAGAGHSTYQLPLPMLNFINGGAHADNALDFQEFMLVPVGADSFDVALAWSSEVFQTLQKAVRDGDDLRSLGVGDEGGFSLFTEPGMTPEEATRFALESLQEVVERANFSFSREGDFAVALDPAASEFYVDGMYRMGGKQGAAARELSSSDMVALYEELVRDYPIVSIEDGMAEDDRKGWAALTRALSSDCQLVGDDLFVTNRFEFEKGIQEDLANAILVKANQIGTLTETLNVIKLAQDTGYGAIVSHRSGETEDTTISDIAVATSAGQIKTGCLSRSDRTSKYNRLLEISEELNPGSRTFSSSSWRDSLRRPRSSV